MASTAATVVFTVVHQHHHHVHLDDDVRHFFLTHLVRPLVLGINRLERHMTEISDFLDAEGTKADNLAADLADVAADVTALLAKAGSAGVFSADEQVKADALSGKFDALTAAVSSLNDEVGDQDGSDTPPADPTD